MNMSSTALSLSSWGFSALMIAAGIGIPIMAALNGVLGARLGSPPLASLIVFGVGAAVCATALAVTGWPAKPAMTIPPMYYFGGVFVAFYALSITYAAPKIGVGNAVMFVLLGQLIAAATIDHFGLMGAIRSPITLQRAAGIVCMVAGVVLARKVV